MQGIFSRTEMLVGPEALEKLRKSKVAVVGIGGVGSFAAEGLVRAGVGNIVLIDDDCVCVTNINRQIHATTETVGKPKVEVMKERILKINPAVSVTTFKAFYPGTDSHGMIPEDCDYIVDAIDTVSSKIELIAEAKSKNIPVISSMGTGNKLHPEKLEVADIYSTSVCPLAKAVRRELKKRGIDSLKVVYSKEEPIPLKFEDTGCGAGCAYSAVCAGNRRAKKSSPGSISFVPSVAGLIIAAEVVRDLIEM